LQEDFEAAAARIKPVTGMANDDMLDLYGLYKQSTHGDNDTGALAAWVARDMLAAG
jgi:acyl-CoA-binding protein